MLSIQFPARQKQHALYVLLVHAPSLSITANSLAIFIAISTFPPLRLLSSLQSRSTPQDIHVETDPAQSHDSFAGHDGDDVRMVLEGVGFLAAMTSYILAHSLLCG